MKRHPLPHHHWGTAPWVPTRGGVWNKGRGRAARVGLHGHPGLGEEGLGDWGHSCRHRRGGPWLLLQRRVLLLFGPVVLDQLGVILLLLPDLNTNITQTRHDGTKPQETNWFLCSH